VWVKREELVAWLVAWIRVCVKDGVTGNLAPQEIWHHHAISPRKTSTLSGKLEPLPCRIFGTSWQIS